MKTLFLDIETSPRLAYVWGHWETNVLDVEREWYILCFAYQWMDDKKVSAYSLPDFKETYRKDDTNDRDLCKKLWELLDEADVVVAHNGSAFDLKKSNARFLFHGFNPPKPYQEVDTLKVARKHFAMSSNKLDDLGDYLGVGRKIHTGGVHLWLDVLRGDKKAWRKMVDYNKQDTALLVSVYYKLRPWMPNHPNANVYNDTLGNCPICGEPSLTKQGFKMSRTGKKQQYQCQSCGGWSSAPVTGVVR